MDHLDPARRSFSALMAPLIIASTLLLAVAACGSEANGSEPSRVDAAIATGEVVVVDPSIDRPANPSVAAVRLTIANGTGDADALIGVSSPDGEASIHRSDVDEQGRSTMTPLDRLELPARSSVEFEPGGLHVMITGITRDLEVGDTVSVTFELEDHGPLVADVPVVDPMDATGDAAGDDAAGGDDEPAAGDHDHAAFAPTTNSTPGALR